MGRCVHTGRLWDLINAQELHVGVNQCATKTRVLRLLIGTICIGEAGISS